MKYMGSKRHMLENGLGDLICNRARYAQRIVDLFCGAGSVTWFAAERTRHPVLAIDLQAYAVILAWAVIGRTAPLDSDKLVMKWFAKVKQARGGSLLWKRAILLEEKIRTTRNLVQRARVLCEEPSNIGPNWNAYGGYYFSPSQSLTFDYMLKHLPRGEPERSACLAATIITASKCAASPGHTAQPFQPTETAGTYLREAWGRNPLSVCKRALDEICARYAHSTGEAFVSDAIDVAPTLHSDDLVIVDPPYSGVQYSRFYHVLETIARGRCEFVNGEGRYPPMVQRPQSDFSKRSQSRFALEKLFSALAKTGATTIVTFPSGECSNGLSGKFLIETACAWFDVEKKIIKGRFSTLGGNNSHRAAQKSSSELLLLLRPK